MNATPTLARHGAVGELGLLLRLRFRTLLRQSTAGRTGGRRQRGLPAGARYLVLVVIAVLISFSAASLLSGVVSGTVGRLLLASLLTWTSTAATLFMFLLAIPMVLAAFTYNSDLKLLLLTPLSPRLLMVEKFVSLYLQLSPLLLVVGIPVLLGVGRTLDLGLGYSLATIVALLLLPLAPLAIAMLVQLVVLRWLPPRLARTFTAVFGTLLALSFYVGIQVFTSQNPKQQRTSNLQHLLSQSPQSWWNSLPTTWAGQGLAAAAQGQTGSAVSYLAATAALGLLLAGGAVLLYARLFSSGWATYQEVGRRSNERVERAPTGAAAILPVGAGPSGAATDAMIGAQAQSAPPLGRAAAGEVGLRQVWRPWLRKEWLSVRRDPTLWTRLAYGLVVMAVGVYRAVDQHLSGSAPRGVRTDTVTFFISLAIAAYILTVFLAPRLVNREGRALYWVALAPVSPRTILLLKAAFCALPALVVVDAVLIAGGVILRLDAWQIALGSFVFALLIGAETGGLLLISLIWPRLDWDNPNRQVSIQAGLYGSFGGLLLTAGVVAALFCTLTGSGGLPAPIYGLASIALPVLVIWVAIAQAPRRFAALLAGER
jgi:ABC-2 type transport system permease protein